MSMMITHYFETHCNQAAAILRSWAMPPENGAQTARVLGWADLRGIESHGIAMLVEYNERRDTRPINMKPRPWIVRETPVSALMDGDGGLGHVPATKAMGLTLEKAKACGVGMV